MAYGECEEGDAGDLSHAVSGDEASGEVGVDSLRFVGGGLSRSSRGARAQRLLAVDGGKRCDGKAAAKRVVSGPEEPAETDLRGERVALQLLWGEDGGDGRRWALSNMSWAAEARMAATPASSWKPIRPLLLSGLMWYALVVGSAVALLAFADATGLALRPLRARAPALTDLGNAWPALLLAAWLFGLGYGIAVHASWTRFAALCWWTATCTAVGFDYWRDFAAGNGSAAFVVAVELSLLLWIVVAFWYFFRKRVVVAYYAGLRSAAQPGNEADRPPLTGSR